MKVKAARFGFCARSRPWPPHEWRDAASASEDSFDSDFDSDEEDEDEEAAAAGTEGDGGDAEEPTEEVRTCS
jgi:hypothetical protein